MPEPKVDAIPAPPPQVTQQQYCPKCNNKLWKVFFITANDGVHESGIGGQCGACGTRVWFIKGIVKETKAS
jgi:hypothetical protein